MNEIIVPADSINEAHRLAKASAETAVEYAIRCGQLLTGRKKQIPHGDWQAWVAENCEFSERQSQRYIKAAKTTLASDLTSDEKLLLGREIWEHTKRREVPDLTSADKSSGVVDAKDETRTKHEPAIDGIDLRKLHEAAELLNDLSHPGVSLHERFGCKLRQGKLPAMFQLCSEAHADMQAAAARKSLITIRLSDNTHYQIPVQFIEDLKDKFPKLDVDRALSDCAVWHGMNPNDRETERGIKRHILVGMKNLHDGLSMWQ